MSDIKYDNVRQYHCMALRLDAQPHLGQQTLPHCSFPPRKGCFMPEYMTAGHLLTLYLDFIAISVKSFPVLQTAIGMTHNPEGHI